MGTLSLYPAFPLSLAIVEQMCYHKGNEREGGIEVPNAERVYMCIDLKSFYASVEAVDRGLDPFHANLVVADPARGKGAICLAITPAMKALGIRNRCRLYEIPPYVEYITALPRMKKYMEISADIYGVYLRYIAPEDIHPYSIDEVFIDATPYLKLYGLTPKALAQKLMAAVMEETGICATAGIGPNLFLAKIALDITAKHVDDHIGILDESSFKHTLWRHQPLTDFWNIGPGITRRLARYGIYDLYGVAHTDEKLLYKEFGKNAEYLIDHAHGREPCTMADIHAYTPSTSSISNSQILFEDYTYKDAFLVLKEMVDMLSLELTEKHMLAKGIALQVGYSKGTDPPTGGSHKLDEPTSSYTALAAEFDAIYRRTTRQATPIRRIGVALTDLVSEDMAEQQLTLFAPPVIDKKEKQLQSTMVELKKRFGKNAILRGMSLQEKATARKRNQLIGGHNSGEQQ